MSGLEILNELQIALQDKDDAENIFQLTKAQILQIEIHKRFGRALSLDGSALGQKQRFLLGLDAY